MATVLIGSARIDERGKASGGQAGDQTGKEVSTQNWYDHSKRWIVLRPKDGAKAQKIAKGMQVGVRQPEYRLRPDQQSVAVESGQGQGL